MTEVIISFLIGVAFYGVIESNIDEENYKVHSGISVICIILIIAIGLFYY